MISVEPSAVWQAVRFVSLSKIFLLTNVEKGRNLLVIRQSIIQSYSFLLFRVMEIHRICEVTATPGQEGANLSEEFEQSEDMISITKKLSAYYQADFFMQTPAKENSRLQ